MHIEDNYKILRLDLYRSSFKRVASWGHNIKEIKLTRCASF